MNSNVKVHSSAMDTEPTTKDTPTIKILKETHAAVSSSEADSDIQLLTLL